MKRMERDLATKQQIESFRNQQAKEMEERKSIYENNVKCPLYIVIQN